MDILNFISWLKSKKQVTTVDASQTLIPLGLKDPRRDDGYIPGAISVDDLLALSPGLPSFIQYDETNKWFNVSGKSTDNSNSAFGLLSLSANANGQNNIAIGLFSLTNNIVGSDNIAIGRNALYYNVVGTRNVGIGTNAINNSTVGEINTAVGFETLAGLTTGVANTAIGYSALFRTTTGILNTALGSSSLYNNFTGVRNTAIGAESLAFDNTSGNDNTAVGYGTKSNNYSSSVILGANATATGNNQFVIGSNTNNAGTIVTEALTPTKSWAVRINGVNYKIPLQVA